jgi:hypothetical protein
MRWGQKRTCRLSIKFKTLKMDDKERISDERLKELSDYNFNVSDFSENGEGQVFVQNVNTYEGTAASIQEVEEKGAEQVFNDAF